MTPLNDKTNVLIFLNRYHIRGDIANFTDTRLTDYINSAKDFIAVTDAEMYDVNGETLLSVPFLNIRTRSIEVILPTESGYIKGSQ